MSASLIKVLVVDDELEILQSLQTNLELDGYFVRTANSAEKAMQLLSEDEFDIVLTDINMPVRDGIDLLADIKEKHCQAIVIMITAYDSMAKVLTSRLYGAFDFVLKPFGDLSELGRVMTVARHQIERWDVVLEELRQRKHSRV